MSDPGLVGESHVEVRQQGDSDRLVLRALAHQANDRVFRAPVGFTTDFASAPRPTVWFLPRYGRNPKAAILLSRADADGIFRQAMRTLEVPFLRRWMTWALSGSGR